jgi:hypothetical protein
VLVEPVQRPSQAVVVEVVGGDARSQEVVDRLVGEELRDEVEPAIAEAQPIEH